MLAMDTSELTSSFHCKAASGAGKNLENDAERRSRTSSVEGVQLVKSHRCKSLDYYASVRQCFRLGAAPATQWQACATEFYRSRLARLSACLLNRVKQASDVLRMWFHVSQAVRDRDLPCMSTCMGVGVEDSRRRPTREPAHNFMPAHGASELTDHLNCRRF